MKITTRKIIEAHPNAEPFWEAEYSCISINGNTRAQAIGKILGFLDLEVLGQMGLDHGAEYGIKIEGD